ELLAAGGDLMEQLPVTRSKLDYACEVRHRGSIRIDRHKTDGKQLGKQHPIAIARHLGHRRLDSRPKVIEAASRNRKLTSRNFYATHRKPPGYASSDWRATTKCGETRRGNLSLKPADM